MRFDPKVNVYRLEDGDVAYRLFREGDAQDAECGVCAADVESVESLADAIDDTGGGLFVRQVVVGRWITLTPCGHRVYVRPDESVAVVMDFPAAVA